MVCWSFAHAPGPLLVTDLSYCSLLYVCVCECVGYVHAKMLCYCPHADGMMCDGMHTYINKHPLICIQVCKVVSISPQCLFVLSLSIVISPSGEHAHTKHSNSIWCVCTESMYGRPTYSRSSTSHITHTLTHTAAAAHNNVDMYCIGLWPRARRRQSLTTLPAHKTVSSARHSTALMR